LEEWITGVMQWWHTAVSIKVTAEGAENAERKYKYLELKKTGENKMCDVACGLKKFLSPITHLRSYITFFTF
jgi:hypothetical protein